MDNKMSELKEELEVEREGIWSFVMKEKIIIAHEAAKTARALQNSCTTVTSGKENLNPNALDLSVSVASATRPDAHHCW
jgi:hypothetical protein